MMEQTIDIDSTPSIPVKRLPVVALALSLLTPGLGQIYNGQFKKAAVVYTSLLILPLITGFFKVATEFYGLLSLVILEMILRIIIISDAIYHARKQKEYTLKPYNTWYYHLIFAATMLLIWFMYPASNVLGIKSFHIPTSACEPTVKVGDYVIADMNAYDEKNPEYGDIIVFKKEDELWFFRVAGLPGDLIQISSNIVVINRQESKSTFLHSVPTNDFAPMQVSYLEYEEEFPNGHKHNIYKLPSSLAGAVSRVDEILVPDNCYYALGDNRDNAFDSRYIGFIHRESIVGRFAYTYWSKSSGRINVDFRHN